MYAIKPLRNFSISKYSESNVCSTSVLNSVGLVPS